MGKEEKWIQQRPLRRTRRQRQRIAKRTFLVLYFGAGGPIIPQEQTKKSHRPPPPSSCPADCVRRFSLSLILSFFFGCRAWRRCAPSSKGEWGMQKATLDDRHVASNIPLKSVQKEIPPVVREGEQGSLQQATAAADTRGLVIFYFCLHAKTNKKNPPIKTKRQQTELDIFFPKKRKLPQPTSLLCIYLYISRYMYLYIKHFYLIFSTILVFIFECKKKERAHNPPPLAYSPPPSPFSAERSGRRTVQL